ncbi:MAG: hypothetical protein OXH83_17280 [Bryobacterales bacterium]|nr:hypothetical protein [Bryobacterales bacterium]
MFEPKTDKAVHGSTVRQARATCLSCSAIMPPGRLRAQLLAQEGEADVVFDDEGHRTGGARMTAVVSICLGQSGRYYRLPKDADYAAVRRAQVRVAQILDEWGRGGGNGVSPVPDEPIAFTEIRGMVPCIWCFVLHVVERLG